MALREFVRNAVVIAWREDVSALVETLESEGFTVAVQRGKYTPEELIYSAIVRCLLNHARAWRDASKRDAPTLIVEADFVPCRGFGSLPLQFPAQSHRLFAWLYSAGSILYGIDRQGFTFGHGNTMVAYVLTPDVAGMLAEFVEQERAAHDFRQHVPFDTRIGIFLRKQKGIRNYVPIRLYGEHGGAPNPEHRIAGIHRGGVHHADVLAGPLAFLPPYANGNRLRYLAVRMIARLRGWARVVTLRYYDPRYINQATDKSRWFMARIAIARLFRLAPTAAP